MRSAALARWATARVQDGYGDVHLAEGEDTVCGTGPGEFGLSSTRLAVTCGDCQRGAFRPSLPRLTALWRGSEVVVLRYGAQSRYPSVIMTPEGKCLSVALSELTGFAPEVSADPPELDPTNRSIKHDPLVVGARVYRVRDNATAEEIRAGGVTVLASLNGGRGGVAIVAWWNPDHHMGPTVSGQAYRADVLTHSPEIAAAGMRVRVAHGWPR